MSLDKQKALWQLLDIELYLTGFLPSSIRCAGTAKSGTDGHVSLQAIARQVRRCNRCLLAQQRTTAVPGEGPPDARVMLLGEAPGMEEDLQGRPFVGNAGQLLDRIIQACGLERTGLFVTNVVKCRPPNNRQPRPEEIVSCLPYLHAQIRLIRPAIMVALGGHAARTLLNVQGPITQLRGQVYLCQVPGCPEKIKVVPTYHPAYLLRNYTYQNRKAVWEDMKLVLNVLGLEAPKGQV